MKSFFAIFFFLNAVCVQAQTAFKKKIVLPNANASFSRDIFELNPNHYVIFGTSIDSLLVSKLTIVHTDSIGTILDKKQYGNGGNFYLPNQGQAHLYRKIDSNFYVPITSYDSTGKVYGTLFKFDLNGNVVWKKTRFVGDSSVLAYYDVCRTKDQGVLVMGRVLTYTPTLTSDPTFQTFLGKYNKAGILIWQKRVNSNSQTNWEIGCSLIEDTATKNILVCGQYGMNNTATGAVFIFDSLGNKVSGFGLNSSAGTFLYDIIRAKDGNFIAVGYKEFGVKINDIPATKSFLFKIAPNGSFIKYNWIDAFSLNSGFSRILELPSGKLITLGFQAWGNTAANEINSVCRVSLLDANTDFVWSKYYDNFTDIFNFDEPWGVALTSDKRLIFTSACYEPSDIGSTFMLYRIDTLSCDNRNDSCSSLTGIQSLFQTATQFEVWPNPCGSNCSIHFENYLDYSNSKIRISDIFGNELEIVRFVGEKFSVDLEGYPNGLYFFTLLEKDLPIAIKKVLK